MTHISKFRTPVVLWAIGLAAVAMAATARPAAAQAFTLDGFTADNGLYGNLFEVSAQQPVIIRNISIWCGTTATGIAVELWYNPTTAVPGSPGWVQAGITTMDFVNASRELVPIAINLVMAPAQVAGICVVAHTSTSIRYTNGGIPDLSDGRLTISGAYGYGCSYNAANVPPVNTPNFPRVFAGSVHYDLADMAVERPAGTIIGAGGNDNVGVLPIGTPTTITYTIRNNGATPLDLTGTPLVDLSGFNNCTATIATPPITPVAPSSTTTFDVEVTPSADPWWFDVSIANSGITSPYAFTVAGPTAVIELQRPLGMAVANGGSDTLGLLPTGTPNTFTYNILNTGPLALNLTGTPQVTFANQTNCTVTLTTPPTSPVPATTGSTTFDIEVTVTAGGPFSFDMSIPNDDPANNPYDVSVDGAAQLTGSFDIGGGAAHFADLGEAFDALEAYGVSGPVTFNLYDDPGMYTADTSYRLDSFVGMGPTNPIVIQAATGENPVLTGGVNVMTSGGDCIILLYAVNNISIIGLEFDGQGTDEQAIGWYNNTSANPCDNMVVANCRFHDFAGSAFGAYNTTSATSWTNCWVQNNFIWNCQVAIFSTYDDGAIWMMRPGDTHIVHNTIVHGTSAFGAAFYHYQGTAGQELTEFSNNIIYGDGAGTYLYEFFNAHPISANGNLWYMGTGVTFGLTTVPDFASWQALGYDAQGFVADPMLVDPVNGDLHTQNLSPAHDRALLIPSIIDDVDGDARPVGSANDIGADENTTPTPQPQIEVQRPLGVVVLGSGTDALGTRSVGTNFSLTYAILNHGAGDLAITAVNLSNHVNCTATVQLQPQTPVTGGNLTSFVVQVNVTAVGAFSFDVSIDSNDLIFSPYPFSASGSGVAQPQLAVQRPAGTTIAHSSVDLLTSTTPGTALMVTYTIANTGLAPLNLTGSPVVLIGTPVNATATVATQPAVTTLAVGATTTFVVQITPTAAGTYSMYVSIQSDDPSHNPYVFTMLGSAVAVNTGSSNSGGCAMVGASGAGGNAALLLLAALVIGVMLSRRRFAHVSE